MKGCTCSLLLVLLGCGHATAQDDCNKAGLIRLQTCVAPGAKLPEGTPSYFYLDATQIATIAPSAPTGCAVVRVGNGRIFVVGSVDEIAAKRSQAIHSAQQCAQQGD